MMAALRDTLLATWFLGYQDLQRPQTWWEAFYIANINNLDQYIQGKKLCQSSHSPLPCHLPPLCWCRPAGRGGGADHAQRGDQQDHQAPPQVAQRTSFLGATHVRGDGSCFQPHTGWLPIEG